MKRNVRYRGLTGFIRRAINSGSLNGDITCDDVQKILPKDKKAPEKKIKQTLHYLAKTREITIINGRFNTSRLVDIIPKSTPPAEKTQTHEQIPLTLKRKVLITAPASTLEPEPEPEVNEKLSLITGKIISSVVKNGSLVATVEVHSLDSSN